MEVILSVGQVSRDTPPSVGMLTCWCLLGTGAGLSVAVFRGELNKEFSKLFELLIMAPRVSHFDGTSFCPRSVHIG